MSNFNRFIKLAAVLGIVLLLVTLGSGSSPEAAPPPNDPAQVLTDNGRLTIRYNGADLLVASAATAAPGGSALAIRSSASAQATPYVLLETTESRGHRGEVEQTIILTVKNSAGPFWLAGAAEASDEGFPAETYSAAQQRFPYIRNSVGLSRNLRNNALYDRHWDWELEGPGDGATQITPEDAAACTAAAGCAAHQFRWVSSGTKIVLAFRPRFYQKHKNVSWFEPWTYKVWQDSIAGWCSWWAYRDAITEAAVRRVTELFAKKLRDFGYQYIQIDDGYETSTAGKPLDFLTTDAKKFPSGLAALAEMIRSHGMKPAIWVNVHFGDPQYVEQNPTFFIRDAGGQPAKGPWIEYGIDGSNPAAVDALVRPLYRQLRQQGWQYVKIDALRHLLYDATYPNRAYFDARGVSGEQAFRNVLTAAREELGPDTYILACWGVLPEVVGIASGDRLGWDGFGPSTLVQYNSWNNVVWRNDPDHADITPPGEEIIRPTLVSMAGAQLLLTDKVEVYEDDAKIEGAKRAAPVLFTTPGQLYDFDPSKANNLIAGLRNQNGGAKPGPIDADQTGVESPWWMLDINRPFESWSVLARLSYQAQPPATVRFADLGLPGDREYLVYEFWSKKFLGRFRDSFPAPAQQAKEVRVYAIRERMDHPQIVSTSRHISQGGVDLDDVSWAAGKLSGRSEVVGGDPYTITIYAPGAKHITAAPGWRVKAEGELVRLSQTPQSTGKLAWWVNFQ